MRFMLKISIITVCLNAEKKIEDTIQSVLSQTYSDIEYIIIDGGSTDPTLAVINRHSQCIAKIISEKDNGIYDAMNKGIQHATGDILYFLNAGDRFFDRTSVASIASLFESNPEADLIIARVKGVHAPFSESEPIPSCEGNFRTPSSILIHGICHQRIFARRELFKRIGMFRLNYLICADQDWVFRAIYQKIEIVFLDQIVAFYDLSGFSRRNPWIMYREGLWARFRNMSLYKFFVFLIPVFYVAVRRRVVNFFKVLRAQEIEAPLDIAKRFAKGVLSFFASAFLSWPKKIQCNVCGWTGRHFLSDSWHKHINCPRCYASIRHRLFMAALQNITDLSPDLILRHKRILHFAPEKSISRILQRQSGGYVTADFLRQDCDFRLNVSDMTGVIQGSAFDVVLAFDVLEHVPDFWKAIEEIHRILSLGGWAVFTVPQKDNLPETYEDPSVVTPGDREKHFGQKDHLRIFGNDFPDIVKGKGFRVRAIDAYAFPEEIRRKNVLTPSTLSKHPLATNDRKVFFCQKVSHDSCISSKVVFIG